MLRYLVKRVLWAIVLTLVLTFVTFVIFFQIPADPARFVIRTQQATESQLKYAREKLGVDQPIYVQYGKFLWRLVHFDFDESFTSMPGQLPQGNTIEVTQVLVDAAPISASLIFGGAVMFLAIAIPLGTLSALRPGSLFDRAALVFVLLGISLHPIALGLLLRHFFGLHWQIAPFGGYCNFFGSGPCGGPADWAHHLLLPWVTFAFLFAALYSRMIRINVLFGLEENYVRTARGKGASEWRILRVHVLRNALLPVVTMLGMDLGVAFGGAIFVERVFSLPGLGTTAVRAARGEVGFDLPIIVGVVVFVSMAIILLNLLVDLMYAWIDPRIRLE